MQKTLGRTTRRVKTSSGRLSSCIHWNSMQVHLCKYIVAKSPIVSCIFTFQCNPVFVLLACQQLQQYMLYAIGILWCLKISKKDFKSQEIYRYSFQFSTILEYQTIILILLSESTYVVATHSAIFFTYFPSSFSYENDSQFWIWKLSSEKVFSQRK